MYHRRFHYLLNLCFQAASLSTNPTKVMSCATYLEWHKAPRLGAALNPRSWLKRWNFWNKWEQEDCFRVWIKLQYKWNPSCNIWYFTVCFCYMMAKIIPTLHLLNCIISSGKSAFTLAFSSPQHIFLAVKGWTRRFFQNCTLLLWKTTQLIFHICNIQSGYLHLHRLNNSLLLCCLFV